MNQRKNQKKKWILSILAIVFTCLYPCVFLFAQNAGEAKFRDIFPFFGLFLAVAAILWLISVLVLRSPGRGAFFSVLTMLVVINFTLVCNLIKKLLPGFHNIYLLLAFGVILLLIGLLLLRKKPDMTVACGLLALVFGFLTLFNLILAVPTMLSVANNKQDITSESGLLEEAEFTKPARNVYYFIFDEYGGPYNLQAYYGYDNEPFLQALEARGFSVSRTSRNTESYYTVTVIPNLLNLAYVTDDTLAFSNSVEWLENPVLYQIFRKNGYEIQLVNQDAFLGEEGCQVLTTHQARETLSAYLFDNSIFRNIPRVNRWIQTYVAKNNAQAALEEAMNAMEGCWQSAAGESPTLTLGYLCTPHGPFIYDENHRALPGNEYNNWKRKELYLHKLETTNALILRTVDHIQKEDPEAVIILQSDHGARYPAHMQTKFDEPPFDPYVEIPRMQNVLNCVYLPGEQLDIEGLTGINTIRLTLNSSLGTTFSDISPVEYPRYEWYREENGLVKPDGEEPVTPASYGGMDVPNLGGPTLPNKES